MSAAPAMDMDGPTELHTHAERMRAAPTKVCRPTCSPSTIAANAVPHNGSVLK